MTKTYGAVDLREAKALLEQDRDLLKAVVQEALQELLEVEMAEARRELAAWLGKWQGRHPKLCTWVEENVEETLSYSRLPPLHHKHMKSTDGRAGDPAGPCLRRSRSRSRARSTDMIVTKIDLHAAGGLRHPRRLATLHVGNVTDRDASPGDGDTYLWHLLEPRRRFSGGLDCTAPARMGSHAVSRRHKRGNHAERSPLA